MDGSAASEHEVSKNVGQEFYVEYSGLLPLVVLALSPLDKALQWLSDAALIHHFYCSEACTQKCEWAHMRWMLPLVELSWETFRETTLSNQRKVVVVWN